MRFVVLTFVLAVGVAGAGVADDSQGAAGITTEEALEVPTDVDDADDIRDDNDPDDVGQEAVTDPVDDWPDPGAEGESTE